MDIYKTGLIIAITCALATAQRPSYAGIRPIGYPEVQGNSVDELLNRFGDDESIPLEAQGIGNLLVVNNIEKLPVDKRPFWYVNAQAYDEMRKRPQVYPQRPNSFIGNITP